MKIPVRRQRLQRAAIASPDQEQKSSLSDEAAAEVTYGKLMDFLDYASKDEHEAEENFLAPARRWFATTLFHLVAGTLGPSRRPPQSAVLLRNGALFPLLHLSNKKGRFFQILRG